MRLVRSLALAAALAVLAGGISFALLRPVQHASEAAVVAVPAVTGDDRDRTAVAESFERSGVAGTFVEVLDAETTARSAGAPPVELDVRAVPASRVIELTATGGRDTVAPALGALITSAQVTVREVDPLWTIRRLNGPSRAEPAGLGLPAVLLATVLLALLVGTFTAVVLGRALRGGAVRDTGGPPPQDHAADEHLVGAAHNGSPRGGRVPGAVR